MYTEYEQRTADIITVMLTNSQAENEISIFLDQDGKNMYLSFTLKMKGMGATMMKVGTKPIIKNHIKVSYTKVKMKGLA